MFKYVPSVVCSSINVLTLNMCVFWLPNFPEGLRTFLPMVQAKSVLQSGKKDFGTYEWLPATRLIDSETRALRDSGLFIHE